MNFNTIIKESLKIISFMGVQYAFGKKGSYPYGILLKFSLLKISIIVVICDMLQTLFLLHLIEVSFDKIKFLKKMVNKIKHSEESEDRSKFRDKFKKWGAWGLFFVAALPYAGGAISGSILAFSMGMGKKKAFIIITLGCILGALIFYLSFAGILTLFK
jgi:uncharacterized membrane protein